MSRIGNSPIELPAGVSVSLSPGRVMVNGPLGELSQNVPQRIAIEQRDGQLVVTRPTERGEDRALHGLTRSLVASSLIFGASVIALNALVDDGRTQHKTTAFAIAIATPIVQTITSTYIEARGPPDR